MKYIGECNYGVGLFKDKQFIYLYSNDYFAHRGIEHKLDISDYSCINDYIYEKNGELYFLKNFNELKLVKIEGLPNLDKHTLKHLQGQYFADKNGLYAFGIHYLGTQNNYANYSPQPKNILIESSNGKIIEPTITRNYIVYGTSVYAKHYSIEKLKLDVDKMIELKWGNQNDYFITDGTNLYENSHSSYLEREWNKNNMYANDFLKSGINILKIFSPQIQFLQANDNNTLYFNNIKRDGTKYTVKKGILIKTDQGYFFANTGHPSTKPQKIDNLVIYNETTKQNETFEEEQFLHIDNYIFAYKGLMFFDNIPFKEIKETKNLRFFIDKGLKTNFLADGNKLIAVGGYSGYQSDYSDGAQKVVFEKWIKKDINISKLRAINKNILVDDRNFYDCSNGRIQIIPFKKLGLDVKLYLPTELMQYDY